jgi:hypothetical protein
MKIRPLEKYLYFPTTFHSPFEHAFEPSSYPHSSVPSSPRLVSFQARLRALDHQRYCVSYPTSIRAHLRALVLFLFEHAFEPSTIKGSAFPILPPFERAFEPSSYLHFKSAFEPSTIKGSAFPILPSFERAFEPLSYLHSSSPLSPRLISISRAPSSPRPSKVVHFLSYLLLSAPSSPHFL